ncbi:hypothetical protein A2U01_0083968, partial [Trifolium medium]|nr:hypothetical protein [Trifolium medium]
WMQGEFDVAACGTAKNSRVGSDPRNTSRGWKTFWGSNGGEACWAI